MAPFSDIINTDPPSKPPHSHILLPKGILHKDAPLTDEETVLYNRHTVYGYLLYAQNRQIPPASAIVALRHHLQLSEKMRNATAYAAKNPQLLFPIELF